MIRPVASEEQRSKPPSKVVPGASVTAERSGPRFLRAAVLMALGFVALAPLWLRSSRSQIGHRVRLLNREASGFETIASGISGSRPRFHRVSGTFGHYAGEGVRTRLSRTGEGRWWFDLRAGDGFTSVAFEAEFEAAGDAWWATRSLLDVTRDFGPIRARTCPSTLRLHLSATRFEAGSPYSYEVSASGVSDRGIHAVLVGWGNGIVGAAGAP